MKLRTDIMDIEGLVLKLGAVIFSGGHFCHLVAITGFRPATVRIFGFSLRVRSGGFEVLSGKSSWEQPKAPADDPSQALRFLQWLALEVSPQIFSKFLCHSLKSSSRVV